MSRENHVRLIKYITYLNILVQAIFFVSDLSTESRTLRTIRSKFSQSLLIPRAYCPVQWSRKILGYLNCFFLNLLSHHQANCISIKKKTNIITHIRRNSSKPICYKLFSGADFVQRRILGIYRMTTVSLIPGVNLVFTQSNNFIIPDHIFERKLNVMQVRPLPDQFAVLIAVFFSSN